METAYVVKLHNFCQLAPAQPCFTFTHPNRSAHGIDNTRYARLRFPAPVSATVHGFAGYFEAKLYGDISISIVPQTFSTGMFSWFPIYIPLRTPVYARKGSAVEVHVWRCVSPRKVRVSARVCVCVSVCERERHGRIWWDGGKGNVCLGLGAVACGVISVS
jgi:type II protein arginine methyltransferase